MKFGYIYGLIIAALSPFVLFLLALVNIYQTLALMLFLVGAWTTVFGSVIANSNDRLYYIVWGLVAVSLSTFIVLPISYSVALVLITIIALTLVYGLKRRS